MFSLKGLFAVSSAAVLLCAVPMVSRAAEDYVKADWRFSEAYAEGSIESGSLTLKDASGNSNDLVMRTYGDNYAKTAAFVDSSLTGGGSISLDGGKNGSSVDDMSGIDFVTVSTAPINKETFKDGYTIEIIYKMPDDWTTADRWTSLLSRLGDSNDAIDDEGESVTSLVHVSNCKEIQFIPANAENKSTLSSNVWSVAMDKSENWYSIVITYDNDTFKTYVNGADSFRNITDTNMVGLYADPSDGRFRIGCRVKNGVPYRFTRGNIQEIRISGKALERSDWLVPNPEEYLTDYGDNRSFDYPEEGDYNFVFLPDMQNTNKFKNDVLERAVDWLIENKDSAAINAVVSLGDNVQDTRATDQWENIQKDMSTLALGGVKTLVQPGNHDTYYGVDALTYWYFTKYFGADSDFQKIVSDYVECSAPSGASFVMDAPAGSFDYKIITIDMYALENGTDVPWFKSQLKKYAENPVIVVSHDIQNASDTAPNETKLSTRGEILWSIVKDYDNVFMMFGGHSHGYGVLELTNSYGHKVYSVLADYQFSYNGGNALFKFCEFSEAKNQIHITTFSPYVATLSDDEKTFFDVNYMTGKGHDDTIEFDFNERLGSITMYIEGENLVSNPSFEENTDGWTANNSGTVKALDSTAWVRSTEQAHSGSYSLKNAQTDGGSSDNNFCTFIPIEAGKIYSVSYWEYSTVDHADDYWRMSACAVVSDIGALGSGNEIMSCGGHSSWNRTTDRRDLSYSKGWTNRTYTLDATDAPDAKYIMIAYAWGDKDTLYIDDFNICEVALEIAKKPTVTALTAEKADGAVNVSATYDISSNPDAALLAVGCDASGAIVSMTKLEDGKATLAGDTITEVRVFCWEGLKNMRPLTKVKVATAK